ncbi:hypothetical protein BYT27DRAFT_7250669 [Phlegmacium glaucopus]|nr:hypothetical protein BYT27DRAFT_7250669 [Phlegmacium glaucopus]
MHSATQIIAQRGTPAARTKPRWQPYSSISSLPARSPSIYLNTPTSVPASPPSATSFSDLNRLRSVASSSGASAFPIPTQTPKDLQRETSKNKFAAGLVDQAVKILSEVWRTQDIPAVFLPPTTTPTQSATAAIKSLSQTHSLGFGNGQSSSPISTSILSAPSQSSSTSIASSSSTAPTSLLSGNDSDHILPIRSFVHEVLRRSRTSGVVLQTALCYLEAIRPKVPNLLREERMGIRAYYEPESRILPATEAELAQEAKLNVLESSIESEGNYDGMDTVRVTDCVDDFDSEPKTFQEDLASSTSASLPSPLLCPRRTFLASVILASKFSQDKCYSNRAWAKLSGLPPREIGRCERALGQALEWRLWVGKTLLSSQTPTPCSNLPLRQVARSQSEGSVLIYTTTQSQFLNQENIPGSVDIPMSGNHRRGLRKCATLPVDALVPQPHIAPSVESTHTHGDNQEANDVPEWKLNSQPLKLPDQPSGLQYSPIPLTESPSPETPGLTYSPSTTDSSSETRTVQMTMFEDNVFPSGNPSQPWLDTNDPPSCKTNVILSSGGNCRNGPFGILSVTDSEAEPFETHQCHGLWYEGNQCIIRDGIGAY